MGSRVSVVEDNRVVGGDTRVADILAVADSRVVTDSRVEQEDIRVVGEDNNHPVDAEIRVAADSPEGDNPAVVEDSSLRFGGDNPVVVADNPAVAADIPVAEEDNRAVAADNNRFVAAARRRTSYRTGRRMCYPG